MWGLHGGGGQRATSPDTRHSLCEEWCEDTWVEDSSEMTWYPLKLWGHGGYVAHLHYGHTPRHRHKLRDADTCSLLVASLYSLLASLLTCWFLPTTARVTIESLPPQVVEGENVLLRVDNMPENLLVFGWYRGMTNLRQAIALHSLYYSVTVKGLKHSGRETLYINGTLWIQNVTQEDTGYYTFQTISKQGEMVSNTSLYLHVYCK